MRLDRVFLALLLCASSSSAAELRLLTGKPVIGELVSLNAKEVVLKTANGPVTTSLVQVLQLDLEPALTPTKEAKWADVELTDGGLLRCGLFSVRGKTAELTLATGQQLKVPLESIRSYLSDAQDEKVVQDWKDRFVNERRTSDLIVIKQPGGKPSGLSGTFGEGSEDGKSIAFDLNSGGNPGKVKFERIHAMLFQRQPPANPPEVLCKVFDTAGDYFVASAIVLGEGGLAVSSPAGAKLNLPIKQVHRLDFSKGKLTFLANLEPSKKIETSTDESIVPYRRNKNLDDQKIHLREPKDPAADLTKVAPQDTVLKEYDNGLSLHAHTELEYDLKGDYNEFKAILGVDETVGSGSDGPVVFKIEGDGKELFTAAVRRKDLARPISVPVKDVGRLRLIVSSGDLLDLGKHLSLAEARVSK